MLKQQPWGQVRPRGCGCGLLVEYADCQEAGEPCVTSCNTLHNFQYVGFFIACEIGWRTSNDVGLKLYVREGSSRAERACWYHVSNVSQQCLKKCM